METHALQLGNVTRHPNYLAQFLRVRDSGSEVSATKFDLATSLCEDSCTVLMDKFTLLVCEVQSICTMIVQ